MATKFVDVLMDGDVVETYQIELDQMDAPPTDEDFIKMAKACMMDDGHPVKDLEEATFAVHDPDGMRL